MKLDRATEAQLTSHQLPSLKATDGGFKLERGVEGKAPPSVARATHLVEAVGGGGQLLMRPAVRHPLSFDQSDFPTLPHFRSWVDFQLAKVLYDLRQVQNTNS